ncbi:MAG: thioredoxin [Bacteroidales bacterium]|nr:thioredoxin [Bacteroidales bacterium]
MAKVVTNDNFKDILASPKPVLVDVWATWCGPCRVLSPIVDEIAEEMADKVDVVKCNVDDADEIAVDCGIRNIPTLLYYKNGELADRTVGVVSKEEIVSRLNALL